MPSFQTFVPPMLAFWPFPRRVTLRRDALDIEFTNRREEIRLADIAYVRAGKSRPPQRYGVARMQYEVFVRDRGGRGRRLQADLGDLDNYIGFMRAFIPAVQKASPDAVFECGIGRWLVAGWGVVAVLFWLALMLALGTKVLHRMMTGTLESVLWLVTGIGVVAIVVYVARLARNRRYGARELLATQLPEPKDFEY